MKFIIHKHIANKRKQHYDMRLEKKNGKAESYATTKKNDNIPPDKAEFNSKNKYLFYRTPDHTGSWLNYKDNFEIEKGYGAGTFEAYDYGTYEIIESKNNYRLLKFDGNKIKGLYVLIHVGNKIYMFFRKKEQTMSEETNMDFISQLSNYSEYNQILKKTERIIQRIKMNYVDKPVFFKPTHINKTLNYNRLFFLNLIDTEEYGTVFMIIKRFLLRYKNGVPSFNQFKQYMSKNINYNTNAVYKLLFLKIIYQMYILLEMYQISFIEMFNTHIFSKIFKNDIILDDDTNQICINMIKMNKFFLFTFLMISFKSIIQFEEVDAVKIRMLRKINTDLAHIKDDIGTDLYSLNTIEKISKIFLISYFGFILPQECTTKTFNSYLITYFVNMFKLNKVWSEYYSKQENWIKEFYSKLFLTINDLLSVSDEIDILNIDEKYPDIIDVDSSESPTKEEENTSDEMIKNIVRKSHSLVFTDIYKRYIINISKKTI